jgi:SAM-dependent methyltransferase
MRTPLDSIFHLPLEIDDAIVWQMGLTGGEARPTLPFSEVGDHYDQGRPSYPSALVDDVLEMSDPGESRVLEVGAGTGQATEQFARRGVEIVAIEPSASMAALARDRCAPFPNVSVLVASFEDWPTDSEKFGLLISAQAFHWVRPEVRVSRAHQCLQPSAGLALFWSHPIWQETDLGADLAEIYQALAPELYGDGPWLPGFSGTHGAERPSESELAGCFGAVSEHRYRWALDYTGTGYLEFAQSFPEHLVLSPIRRGLLFARIAEVIGDGVISMHFETRLYFATRIG